ncbi:methyl-accepting chemotaxis protein [Anaerosacchariphilus polymeriproducens]|uniref:Methyl-accepting chemotaxis protein n=1 Tax=Anaerosacchariphilus polymeriproducens TaxID=1812858 RepID=A0A371AQW8_9FIRM|nr:methyl-accepting chemotaxis protein [Anaerosacchariphilus polymeriproducens]RDU21968.1 methyl-accepting chemotaxis protein [Anaerosacchariphilus polymeriproducens]
MSIKKRIMSILVILTLLLLILSGGLSAYLYQKAIMEKVTAGYGILKTAEKFIDPEKYMTLVEKQDPKNPYYLEIGKTFQEIVDANDILYIYSESLNKDGNTIYVLDTVTDVADATLGDVVNETEVMDTKELLETLSKGTNNYSIDKTKEYGTILSCYTPIKSDDGKVIGVLSLDLKMKEVIKDAVRSIMKVVGIILLLCIFMSVFMYYILDKHISKPILQFAGNLEVITKGDFSNSLPKSLCEGKSEIAKLAKAFERMRLYICELITNIRAEADTIRNAIEQVNLETDKLNYEIKGAADITNQLAGGMENTSYSAQSIEHASNEIAEVARNIAMRSQEGVEHSTNITERARETQRGVENSILEANKIRTEINAQLSEAFSRIEVLDKISVLSEAIMSITSQTNLLALNASIEAARAGESGRGFAVVANEIGTLANQSQKNVLEIQEVLEEVYTATKFLTDSARFSLSFIENEVFKDYNKLSDVAMNYNNDAAFVNELVSDFSATSEELLASIENILNAISQVTEASEEGTAGTKNIVDRNKTIILNSNNVTKEMSTVINSINALLEHTSKFRV